MTLENFALVSRGASGTCPYESGLYTVERMMDDDGLTDWRSYNGVLANKQFTIDLNRLAAIQEIKVYQSNSQFYTVYQYEVYISNDSTNWVLLLTRDVMSNEETYSITPTQARYWKFVATTAGGVGTWTAYTCELWGSDDLAELPVPAVGVIADHIQWLYDHAYQDAADKLEALDPGWNFSIVETFLLAGMATCVHMMQSIQQQLQGVGGGTFDDTAILAAISAHDDTLLAAEQALSLQSTNIAGQITSLDAAIFNESQVRVDGLVQFLVNGMEAIQTNDNTNAGAMVTHVNTKAAEIIAAMPDEVTVDLQPVLTAVAGVAGDVATAVNPHTTAAKDSINGNVDAAEGAILDAIAAVQGDTNDLQSSATTALADLNEIQATLAGLVIPTSGGLRWPGSESVTLSTPVVLSEPTTITADCHGCIVDVLVVPSGQSVQHADTATRYKGIAWLAFESDRGDWEALQQINLGRQVLLSKELEEASALAVYCKPGAQLRVTPFTLTPA